MRANSGTTWLLRLALPLALALATASPGAAGAGVQPMRLGAPAPPPAGLVALCERRPADCGISASEGRLAELRIQRVRRPGSAQAAAHAASEVDWATAFAAARLGLGREDPAERSAAQVDRASVEGRMRAVTRRSSEWSLVTDINRRINRAITPQEEGAGVRDDRWALPLEEGRVASGDCEDFVLEKRRALIAAGLPGEALSIAVVSAGRGQIHAVLLVNTDEGEYVLDNLSPWVLPWTKTSYQWRKRQAGTGPLDWVEIETGGERVTPVRTASSTPG